VAFASVAVDAVRVSFISHPHAAIAILFPYTTLFRSPSPNSCSHSRFTTVRAVRGLSSCTSHFANPSRLRGKSDGQSFNASGTSRSEEHTPELQSRENVVCCLLLEKT